MKKRILQVNCSLKGSTGKLVTQIHQYISKNGYDSYIAYGYHGSNIENSYQISNWFDIRLHDKLSSLFCMQGEFSIIPTLKFISYIKQVNPDIIHLHNLHGNYVNYRLLFKFLGKTKKNVIWTLHDCWAFTGKCPHFAIMKCEKWKTECCDCVQLKTYPKSYFLDNTKNCYYRKKKYFTLLENMKIITVSKWLKSVAEQSFLNRYPIEVIYNGVDTSIFKPTMSDIKSKLNIDNKFMILGVASNFSKSKGIGEFIKLSKMIDRKSVIVLVGVRENLISSLPDNIIGIKRTENIQKLVELYSSASVLANLTTEESFGLVVAEAMACGTPVVVYKSTACPELIGNYTGFMVKPHDTDGVINALREIQLKGKSQYTEACINRVKQNFENQIMASSYLNEYKDYFI